MDIKRKYRNFLRLRLDHKNRRRLDNHDFTIISSNCVGGVIYHALGMKFRTPTINMYILPKDFVKLCADLPKYILIEPEVDMTMNMGFPVLKIEDIFLFCNHAKDGKQAIEDWNRRKERINYKNICYIMCERDGCTEQDIESFSDLPLDNKVVFVDHEMPEIRCAVYIPGIENKDDEHKIQSITGYLGSFTGKRWIDKFDYVTFFNQMKRS